MSPKRELGKREKITVLLILILFLLSSITLLLVYFVGTSGEEQLKQPFRVLTNDSLLNLEYPLTYISLNQSENITDCDIPNTIYSASSSNHKSSKKSSSSNSKSSYSLTIVCGNAITEQGEECDDGNDDDNDGCNNLCEFQYYEPEECGNNITEDDEECDLGDDNGNKCFSLYNTSCTYCSTSCKNKTSIRFCGDNGLDSEEECDDGNLINGDGCSSNCTIEPECCDDGNCPVDKFSDNYCYSDDVYKNLTDYFCKNERCGFNLTSLFVQDCGIDSCNSWTDYTCEGNNKTRTRDCYDKGCSSGACFDYSTTEIDAEVCTYGCFDGDCLPAPVCGNAIKEGTEECDDGNLINNDGCDSSCNLEIFCYNNSDCGTNDWLHQEVCEYTRDIFDLWITYTCEAPGTAQSRCTNSTIKKIKQDCGENTCTDFTNYCFEDDIYKHQTCSLVGCLLGETTCFSNSVINSSFVQDCGIDSCNSWTDYTCEGNNKTRTRDCYDKGCSSGACFDYSTTEIDAEVCTYGCFDGDCLPAPVCGNAIKEGTEECDDGNLINNDGCDSSCNLEICEHDVGIRYSYGNSFGTGIAIGLLNSTWLDNPVQLNQMQNYLLKYFIDNNIENTTNNIHVIVKINAGDILGYKKVSGNNARGSGGGRGGIEPLYVPIYGNETILADYNSPIDNYHSNQITLNLSDIFAGNYTLSVYVEKINETDCNPDDNYAERNITIVSECCGDGDCQNDSYSDNYCYNNNVWKNLTDYFCKDGKCLFNLTSELFIDCGNKTYSSEYCFNDDVYQNYSIPGCDTGACTLTSGINKTQECGNNSSDEVKYCYNNNVWINKSELLNGCDTGICFHSSSFSSDLFDNCGLDSCNNWTDYTCEGNNKTRTRDCYDKGCSSGACFNTSNTEKQSEICIYGCTNGTCNLPVCGNNIREGIEECDDGNLNNSDNCRNNCILPKCGDNILDSGEKCDDGNTLSGDGCDKFCNNESFENNESSLSLWMCDSRLVLDDLVEPGTTSGINLTERQNNYAFEGEQIQWTVLVRDIKGINKIKDVYATVGYDNQGAGNPIQANCVEKENTSSIILPSCNARILEEQLINFSSSTMKYYTCTLTVEPDMYGEAWITTEAVTTDGLNVTMDENEYWFLNPIITLTINGNLSFNKVQPGTTSYSDTILLGNSADEKSGVRLEMFIAGTDFYDSSSSGAMCPTSNILSLSNFAYFATNGYYSTSTIGDAEGYISIPSGNRITQSKEIIGTRNYNSTMANNPANILTPGSEMALTFRLNLPEPCNGDFDTGEIYFWAEAI